MQTMVLQQNIRRQRFPDDVAEAAKREAKLPMLQVNIQKAEGEAHKASRV